MDPLLASGKSANPQTFNRYVYVGNNPLLRVDRDGRIWGRADDGTIKYFKTRAALRKAGYEEKPVGYRYIAGKRMVELGSGRTWRYIDQGPAGEFRSQPSETPLDSSQRGRLDAMADASKPIPRALAELGVTALGGGILFAPAAAMGTALFVPAAILYSGAELRNLYGDQARECEMSQIFGAGGIDADRSWAVNQAWKQEQELVRQTGQGTRAWTPGEKEQLLGPKGKVDGYEGHHINSVRDNPGLARTPNNVIFVTFEKHLRRLHRGNFRNGTIGPLIERTPPNPVPERLPATRPRRVR